MLRLVNSKDFPNYAAMVEITQSIRSTFTDVFAPWYTSLLAPELNKELKRQEVKEAEELKQSPNQVVKGFSDLLAKKNFFEKDLSAYREKSEIQKVLAEIYSGPGFDDDAAFILAFYDLNSATDARTHYENIKARLSAGLQAEVTEYLKILEKSQRELKAVNFLALVNQDNKVQGFLIFHVLIENGKTILHVRQSAMRHRNRGYASLMATYFADHYAYATYEANQRSANTVAMKTKLIEENLLTTGLAVLGYNTDFYLSLRGTDTTLKLFLTHQKTNHADKPLFAKFGIYGEAESIQPFFSQVRLQKDWFALQDDNYCKNSLFALRRGVDVKEVIDSCAAKRIK